MTAPDPTAADPPRIAVVGAGLAGLMCARTLADQGLVVRVFERSRGLGGRCGTRRVWNKLLHMACGRLNQCKRNAA